MKGVWFGWLAGWLLLMMMMTSRKEGSLVLFPVGAVVQFDAWICVARMAPKAKLASPHPPLPNGFIPRVASKKLISEYPPRRKKKTLIGENFGNSEMN